MKHSRVSTANAVLGIQFLVLLVASYLLCSLALDHIFLPTQRTSLLRIAMEGLALFVTGAVSLIIVSLTGRFLLGAAEYREWVAQVSGEPKSRIDIYIRKFIVYFLALIPYRDRDA